ncbi:MAG: hypothetical protein OXJ64_06350 [Boseongicola sp.]|nr:hypothetical protein [Boseongicola sp.]
MAWQKIIGSKWLPVVGAGIGAPGTLDDIDAWQDTVGDMSTLWQGMSIGVGAAIVGMWIFVMCVTHWPKIRKTILSDWKWPFIISTIFMFLFVWSVVMARLLNKLFDEWGVF